MAMYPGVSRICTLCHSVHLHYPGISLHPPSLINDVLRGRDQVTWEMHLEAEIKWTQRCTCRPESSELRDTLQSHDRVRLEEYLEVVDLEGGAMAAETVFIG